MRNYSRDLLDQEERRAYGEDFMAHFEERGQRIAQLDAIRNKPEVYNSVLPGAIAQQKAEHWGQVVPIEDAEQILDLQVSIIRMPCVCRQMTTGRQARYCFGIGADPIGELPKYPDYAGSFDVVDKEEAKKAFRAFDRQGMVHSVWTFKAPYIGGLCNCDQDCMAYRVSVKTDVLPVMFRSEYVGLVDWDACTGCKSCLEQCQFGAIGYSRLADRVMIDTRQCYGCGLCRAACKHDAIALKPRTDFVGLPWV
jgi:ferredoxin